jgi:hypothetical protein
MGNRSRPQQRRNSDGSTRPAGKTADPKATPNSKRPRRLRRWGIFFLVLILIGAVGRALLPWAVRDYVNRTLDRNPLYAGKIGQVQIHLWRGAYSILDVSLSKTTGNVPVPFFAAKRVDFALQWNALFHRKVVGQLLMEQPELNFVDAPEDNESQTGEGSPWLQMIRDLFPFTINSAIIHNGSVHFRAYQANKPVDVYLGNFQGSIDNLSNIRGETNPLVATVQATASVMEQANLEFKMTLDPFSYRPTFHLVLRLLGLDLVKINDLALAYGKFDFKRGWFDLVVEADSKEGQLTGYVKPLFRNIKVFSLTQDLQEDSILQFFWQALVGAATSIFKNQSRDQFGTLIPFTGDASAGTTTDILATIGNVLRNAFVRAYLPRLENGETSTSGLTFAPADLSDPISAGDPP